MPFFRKLIARPGLYAVWAGCVLVALYATYFADPYVFAFTVLGLAWLTGGVALVGLGVCLFGRKVSRRGKAVIVTSLAGAGAGIARALHTLSGFNWA